MMLRDIFGTRRKPLLIVSFPKSGRTWLRVMLDDLGVEAEYTHDGSDHKEFRSFSSLEKNKASYRSRNILVVVRDPRDTVVSGYFQVQKRHSIDVKGFDDFIRSDNHGIRKVAVFNINWFNAISTIDNINYVQYEDIQRDTVTVIESISQIAGKEILRDEISKIARNRSFENMRASEASGEFVERYGNILLPRDPTDPESFKVRKGKVGGYKEYLSIDDVEYCDGVLAELNYWDRLQATFDRKGISYQRVTPSIGTDA